VRFACTGARPEPFAAGPSLLFDLRIADDSGRRVHSIALRTQFRIEPRQRPYAPEEQARLVDLFGEPARWGETLKPLQFAHVSMMIPGFQGSTELDLPVPCTYDFEVAAAKYLHALDDGEVPLLLLFSGTVFAKGGDGMSVEQVPWHKEASYRMPVKVWRELMDLYFPNSAWIRLRRDTVDDLQRFKARAALPTWDQALAVLLERAGEGE
jgi:hypothetical protein